MRRSRSGSIKILLLAFIGMMPLTTLAQVPSPTAPLFIEGDIACGRIALVFTLGTGGTPSDAALQALVEQNVDATMFPSGEFAESNPDVLRQMDAAGFEIGIYGADIRSSRAAIEDVIGRGIDPYYLPSSIEADERERAAAVSEGLLPVGWSVDVPVGVTEEAVYLDVVHNVYPGAIVRMPLDGSDTDDAMETALSRIVDDLRARGYEFVTIGELLEPCPGPPTDVPGTFTLTGLDVHGLHCKAAPSLGAPTIRILLDGETVSVRGPVFDGWLPVECGGKDGWIKATALAGTS